MEPNLRHEVLRAIQADCVRKNIKDPIIQPSFLQMELLTVNGNPTYVFGVKNSDQPSKRSSETRLDPNNAFVITDIGLFLKAESAVIPGSGVLQCYPNATVFPAEAANLVIEDLESLFNSKLSLKVGQTTFINNLDMSLSRTVRTTQQSSPTTRSEKLGDDGYQVSEPIVTISGSDNNEVVLTVPAWAAQKVQYSTAAAGLGVYLVLKVQGFLVTNGSKLGQIGKQ